MTDLVSLKKYRKCLILRSVTWDYRHINDVMHVAVIGATGATGRQVVQQSLTRKWSVTVIVRNQDSFKDIVDENLKVIVGDVYDTTSLRGAFQGCDAVLSCLGPRGLSNLLPWANVDIYSEPLRCTVQAMNNTHGLNRLVLLTGACTKASPQNPFLFEWVLKPIIRAPVADMVRAEDFLESEECANINYTVAKPKNLTDGPMTEIDLVTAEGQYAEGPSFISRADVAKFMLNCVEKETWKRKLVAISVP
ncbi:hypothetical protein CAPTEDRAFT_222900 [Capitella teleta]|uniref:NAD(P)-binding domain-containing protein n=1 Tax=Capitella teleta TaxID=283909 RepID=R7TIA7_CAPTE|nr:hypothetical protein CAPTEDRAFT_222900 [Capitella teleta]|eukprot:ELT93464.1 hypothetical protein CAPTEDRAFT_222900 [Capitella teleta]